jgi:hypothetical protein
MSYILLLIKKYKMFSQKRKGRHLHIHALCSADNSANNKKKNISSKVNSNHTKMNNLNDQKPKKPL